MARRWSLGFTGQCELSSYSLRRAAVATVGCFQFFYQPAWPPRLADESLLTMRQRQILT